jgi:hypothetical protein
VTQEQDDRMAALEAIDNADKVVIDYKGASLNPLRERIAALEDTVRLICGTELACRVTSLEASRAGQWERIKALEMLLAKQRTVNEILLRYNDDDPVLAAALRETLKP